MADSQPEPEAQTPAKRSSQEEIESDRTKSTKVDTADAPQAPAETPSTEDKGPPATVEATSSGETKEEEKSSEKRAEPQGSSQESKPSRTQGIDPSGLKTLKVLYEENYFDQVTEEDIVYPYKEVLNDKVVVWRGDITKLAVGAIVNAANRSLLGGGGVDGAIHSAAGRGLYLECKTLNGAETGESKITGGHRLPAEHVIHTVGPVYSSSKKQECESLLRSCYQTTLDVAVENGVRTIAFSGISTGIYGYPLNAATTVALDVVRSFLDSPNGDKLDLVIFTVFRQIDVDSYIECVPKFFPPPSSSAPTDQAATESTATSNESGALATSTEAETETEPVKDSETA